jgi:hypothetical protein
VTGEREEARQHPQDATYQERPLGCVEVVTPTSPMGNGGFFQARFAKAGIPVMPDLNDPRSTSETRTEKAHQAIPPGTTSSTPPCR